MKCILTISPGSSRLSPRHETGAGLLPPSGRPWLPAALAVASLALAAPPAHSADLNVIDGGSVTVSRNGTTGTPGMFGGPLSAGTTTYANADIVASSLTQEDGAVFTGNVGTDASDYYASGGSVGGTVTIGGASRGYISGGTFGNVTTGGGADTLDLFGTFTGYSPSVNLTTTPVTLTITGTLLNNMSPSTFYVTEGQYDSLEFNVGTPPPALPALPPAAVPEPSTVAPFALGALGLLGLTLRARRQREAA